MTEGDFENIAHQAATEAVKQIVPLVERVERAMFGEPAVGFTGLVSRVTNEESARVAGDAKLHGRVETEIAKIEADMKTLREEVAALKGQFNRVMWLAAGIGIGAGGGSSLLIQVFSGG